MSSQRNGHGPLDDLERDAQAEPPDPEEEDVERPAPPKPAPQLDLDAALEPKIARACREIAAWALVSAEVVVTCLLAHVSAAIGCTRWVRARGRDIPLSLHYLTSLPSGSGKSSVRHEMNKAGAPIEALVLDRQADAKRELAEHEERLARWKKQEPGSRGDKPTPPKLSPNGGPRVTYKFTQGTSAGIIATLEDSPRGLLWSSDEAHDAIGSLGAYATGQRSADAARLRKLTESQPLEEHRARSNADPLRRLERPWLALDLDVQPGVLRTLFEGEDLVSGLTARLLISEPPELQGLRNYLDPAPPPSEVTSRMLAKRLEALFAVDLQLDARGVPQYEPLDLTVEAERAWAEEMQAMEARYLEQPSPAMVGALGHARGRILRLAGVLALLRRPDADKVEIEDMRRAVVHMRYHLAHAERLFPRPEEGGGEGDLRDLVKFVRARGVVTARDVGRNLRKYDDPGGTERAREDLEKLVKWGDLVRIPGPRTVRYRVADTPHRHADADTSGLSGAENGDSVGVGASASPPRAEPTSSPPPSSGAAPTPPDGAETEPIRARDLTPDEQAQVEAYAREYGGRP